MGLLTRQERGKLLDLLGRLPNIDNPSVRRRLIQNLPQQLQHAIEHSSITDVHIDNIVDVADGATWHKLLDGRCSILVIIENAMNRVQGSLIEQEFKDLLQTLEPRCGSPPGGTVRIPTPPPIPSGGQPRIPSNSTIDVPLTMSVSWEARNRLVRLISETPPFRLGGPVERISLMIRAGLPESWIAQYNWDYTAVVAADRFLDETLRLGFLINPARRGYSALALVLVRIIEEDMVSRSGALFLAKILVCWRLLDLNQAIVSAQLQELIDESLLEVGDCHDFLL